MSLHLSIMKKILIILTILFASINSYSQVLTYCAYDSYKSKYELSLTQGEGALTYKKYSSDGNLIQTLYGTFEVRDEGVYGPARKVVASINGSTVKWLIILNGSGEIQELRDESAGRVWSPCNSQKK